MAQLISYLGSFFELPAPEMPKHTAPRLSDSELARATARLLVSCNDIYFVDTKGCVVLAKRRHAAAKGWWVFGGMGTTGITDKESVRRLLQREVGLALDAVPVALYEHHFADSRERPGEYRQDRILAWMAQVSEMDIERITLNPDEYEVEAGIMRFDGSQVGLRPVLYEMLKVIRQHISN